jgi:hypothetical protein
MEAKGAAVPPVAQAKVKVSPQVARIIKEGTEEEQLRTARGEVPLTPRDLLTTLFFLVHGGNPQLRAAALGTVRTLQPAPLQELLADGDLHPRLVDFLARVRITDQAVMAALLRHPGLSWETLSHLAGHAPPAVLQLLGEESLLKRHPGLSGLLSANPRFPQATPPAADPLPPAAEAPPVEEGEAEGEEGNDPECPEEEINLSKYQQALEMGVSAKIKMALTGDKEWRAIFLKDANKLVCSAVLKNPRITEGEVLAVARSKTSSEELIRLITLNPDWMKNVQIQKALVVQPRTPLPKALRYMGVLTEKDLKVLAKSRGVSQVIVNTARRMLMAKAQKK